jgi:hypothetical protein
VTRNTQPVIANPGFDADSDWTKQPGWSITGGVGVHTGLQSSIYQPQAIVGNRFLITHTLTSNGAGGESYNYAGGTAGTTRTTPGTYTDELTCSVATNIAVSGLNDVEVDNVAAYNLSVSQVTCKGNLGNLTQATAANMPWDSDASAPTSVLVNGKRVLYFDGVADYVASPEAASTFPFHKAAGFTASFFVRPSDDLLGCILTTANGILTDTGIRLMRINATKALNLYICNGGGVAATIDYTSTAILTKNVSHVVSLTWSESGGLRLLIDGSAAETAATTGAVSAGDATSTLHIGDRPWLDVSLAGALGSLLLRVGAVSDAQLLQLHNYMRSYYGL